MGTGEEPPARRESGGKRRRWMDGDDDDDEEYVADEEEEDDFAEELSASSAGEEGEDSDAEYQEDEDEDEEEETPRAKRPVKGGARRRKGKTDPATKRAKRGRYDVDDDYEEDPSENEEDPDEDEEYIEETPRPKRPVKGSASVRKGKMNSATVRAPQRRYETDDDYEEEPDDDYEEEPDEEEEEPDQEEEVEEYHEEIEEEEEAPPPPKSVAKSTSRSQNVDLSRSHRTKYEEDMDFEPELDDDEEEEEVDEDIDFDPEVDDEDELEDEEEEFSATRARKLTVKNPAKRKSFSKRRSLKKKASKGSKASKRKARSAKSKKSASVRRVRKCFVVDESNDDSEDDDDFIVDDEIELNQHPRKKARTGTSKQRELECPSVAEEGTWPTLESETSEFEFVTSDDEPDDADKTVVEASTVRKGRKKRKSGLESSSDSEFVLSDKELEDLGETEPPKVEPMLLTPIRKNSITRHGEDKGKRKEELEEAGKPICGICLSEEQRATVQGVLNCCSHYFCFACIMEWSRVESRCPLCKQRFTTITKSSKADLGLGLRKAVIKVEERDQVYQPTEEEIRRWLDPYENVVCIECNQGGDDSLMLLCDICDSSAHTYCVGLGREVPEGNWYCGGCRLNDEGPSHVGTLHTVGYERQSYRNHVDFGPVGFSMAAQNGTCDRSSSINRRRSFQGIDLNLSPREVPGEIHPANSQASTDNVSTPSGRHQTVSGRRQIHRFIRILLTQPRQGTTGRVEETRPNFIPHNGAVQRTELNHHSFRSSSEANPSQIPDGIQNQRNGLPFAPSMPIDDDFHHIEGVKSNLRNMQ